MQTYPPTIIVRHRRERVKKCSLRGLEQRTDCLFYRYPSPILPPAEGYIILALEGEELSRDDADAGILLLDSGWRYTNKMLQWATQIPQLQYRSLPASIKTAYPRRQEDCLDPERGLASVEALYATYSILGRSVDGLLDHYHWKDQFIAQFGVENM